VWRWESYGGVEVQVPADWGYGNSFWPPCVDQPGKPYVGRPGMIPLVHCGGMVVPPLGKRVAYLWFAAPVEAGVRFDDGGWTEETRVVAGVSLTVLTDDAALRARILDSARPGIGGCPAEHPITSGPDARPDPGPGGLATVGTVESITLCRYAIGRRRRPELSPVLSTSALTGEEARAVVLAILAAPEGHGPNSPDDCMPEVAYGDEVLLLTVRGSARTQEVFVRYSGCDGHGIDDGHTHRRLTTEALKPLLSGPHSPTALNRSVAELLRPR
jgi:hypothetical protein